MKTNNPVKGSIYDLAEVFDLNLLDSPSLGFSYNGRQCVIQDSHVTVEEVLSVPGLAATEWRYVRTTSEWIPVFEAINDAAVIACLDIEPEFDPHDEDAERFWVTPKGFPRSQYYVPFSVGVSYPVTKIVNNEHGLPACLRNGDKLESFDSLSLGAALSEYQFVELVRIDGIVKAVFEVQQ